MEENIGIKWFARIGMLALVLGICFFIKYAIDQNLIDYMTRIVIGLVVGLLLVIVGQFFFGNKDLFLWSGTLVGGGIAIMYFSSYAAYYFEEYRSALGINIWAEVALLSFIVLLGIFLSIKNDSKVIAAEAFFLGFLTSLLSQDFTVITLVYNLLLTLGLVLLVIFKKWSVFGIGGVIATYFVFLPWYLQNKADFGVALIFLMSYFILYTLQSIFGDIDEDSLNIGVILINAFAFLLLSYNLISDIYPDMKGLYLFVVAMIYFLLYITSSSRVQISNTYLSLALFTLTLAIPVQLNDSYIGIVWALETVLLTAVAINSDIRPLQIGSYVVGIISAIKIILYDSWLLEAFSWNNLAGSTRFFSFIVGIICFYLCAYLYRKGKKNVTIKNMFVLAASFMTVLIILLEADSPWQSILLSIFILIIVVLCSFMKDSSALWLSSVLTAGLLLLKLILFDSWNLMTDINVLLSQRAQIFFIVSLIFYLCSWIRSLEEDESSTKFYSWSATSLFVILLGLELNGYWLSISWGVMGLILLIIGMLVHSKVLRMQGMTILCLSIVKAFLYDVWELEPIYRTVSFIVLGAILMLVSLLYSKYKEKIAGIVKN